MRRSEFDLRSKLRGSAPLPRVLPADDEAVEDLLTFLDNQTVALESGGGEGYGMVGNFLVCRGYAALSEQSSCLAVGRCKLTSRYCR